MMEVLDSSDGDEDAYRDTDPSSTAVMSKGEEEKAIEVIKDLMQAAKNKDRELAGETEKARTYQTGLLELARKQNIIICLPTGSGKTFIAAQLMKDYIVTTVERKSKIVFLANTLPLVDQQWKYFQRYISMEKISKFTGDMNVNNWTPKEWRIRIDKCNVMVMTAQVFADIWNKYIKFEDVCLLIFDECHHVGKDHPMNQIMKNYRDIRSTQPAYPLPKVLGLTATIIRGVGRHDNIPDDVTLVETNMCSKAVTYHEYEEVLRNSTNSGLDFKGYTNVTSDEGNGFLKPLVSIQAFLEILPEGKADTKGREEELASVHKSQIYGKKIGIVKELLNMISELIEMYSELGGYCARLGSLIRLAGLQAKMALENDEFRTRILNRVITGLHIFVDKTHNFSPSKHVSDKVLQLRQVLSEQHPSRIRNGDPLCGLIFVRRRIIAQVLNFYTHDLSKALPEQFGFLKANFILGISGNGGSLDAEEARMSIKKQNEIIWGFYNKVYNLLYCTQVLEEGLNVPSCNVVVRFDLVETYSSFVQSMGRGRKRDSSFIVFIDQEKESEQKEKYLSFQEYSLGLSSHLRKNAIHLDEDEVEAIPDDMEHMYPPFCPGGTLNSPRISMTASSQVISNYCQLLQSDRFSRLQAVSWWEKCVSDVGVAGFRANILLPRSAIIKSKISGPIMPTRALAKRAAYLDACRQLYHCGALDENLIPRRKGISEEVEKCLELIEVEDQGDGPKRGTKKRVLWYEKKIPDLFQDLSTEPGPIWNVYLFDFQLLDPKNTEKEKVYTFNDKDFFFAVLIHKSLEMIPGFQLETNLGPIGCILKDVTYKCPVFLNQNEVVALQEFEKYTFYRVLGLDLGLTQLNDKCPYLIAPLQKGSTQELTIFWEGVRNIREFDNISRYLSRPTPEELSKLSTGTDKYVDSIVIPYYKPTLEMYCVSNVIQDKTPSSPFDDPLKCSTFEHYYRQQYGLKVTHPHQPLLKGCPIAKQLNFLVLKTDSKKSRNQLKYEKRREYDVTLIPEFVRIFPFPASMYVQLRFLPSVLHRIYRLLLSREIRLSVANGSSWSAALASDVLLKSSDGEVYESVAGPQKNSKNSRNASGQDSIEEIDSPRSQLNNFKELLQQAKAAEEGDKRSVQEEVQVQLPSESEKDAEIPCLDYIHPAELDQELILKANSDKIQRKREREKRETLGLPKEEPIEEPEFKLMSMDDIKLDTLDQLFDSTKDSGPSLYKIMEALTLANANDSLSQERLELMGDSFLKYCATMHIYCNFADYDEGQMTTIRSRLVSNAALCTVGKKRKLGEILSGGIFIPKTNWLPAGLKIPENFTNAAIKLNSTLEIFVGQNPEELQKMSTTELEKVGRRWLGNETNKVNDSRTTLTHTLLGDKNVADCVEALIGAYYTSGGPQSALRFMDSFGLRAPNSVGEKVAFGNWMLPNPRREAGWIKSHTYNKFIPFRQDLEELICYKFKDPWYLVEAFTHPGYTENRGTDSYERLEFLGDAVLDYLVTNHIYTHSDAQTPGDLTDLRSALVNNVTFGSLAVRYGLHRFLLHHSQELQLAIEIFERSQRSNGHKVTGHFSLLSDYETIVDVAEDIDVPKVLGDLFESLAGAVFVDCDFNLDVMWKVFYRLMKNEIDEFSKKVPKSPLREIYERFPKSVRVFQNVNDSGVPCGYTVAEIKIDGKTYHGLGKNKQRAKLAAAKFVIKSLNDAIKKEA